jgi:hypothetical protein
MSDLNIVSQQAIRGEFLAALKAYQRPAWLSKILTTFVGPDNLRLPWIGGISSGMALRTGSGVRERPNLQYIDLAVSEYEDGAEIPLRDMQRDVTGTLNRQLILNALAKHDQMHWEKLVMAALYAGTSTLCYDNAYFFADSHADADGSYTTAQDNNIDSDISGLPGGIHGSTTVPSIEEIIFAACDGIAKLVSFRDNMGEFVNEDMRSVIVFMSTSMMAQALAARQQLVGNGQSNPLDAIKAQTGLEVEFVASPRLIGWTASLAVIRADSDRPVFVGLEEKLDPRLALKIYELDSSDEAKKKEAYMVERRANRKLKIGDWRNGCYVTLV